MKAAVWHGREDIRIEDKALSPLKDNEVTIRVAWAGICGSDLHEFEEGPVFIPTQARDGLTGGLAPLTMGHEFSGVVEAVGKNVTEYKVGDRVSVNPTITYGKRSEYDDIYDGFSFIGLHCDGGFADFVNVPESAVYHLPDHLSLETAALIEPTAVAVQAVKEGGLRFGDTVAVFGAGPIGLVTIAAAKAGGATKVIALDLSDSRLEMAKAMGATHIINSGKEDAVTAVRNIVPRGVDVAFEVAGVQQTVEQSINVTRPRGTMVIISIFAAPITWHPMQLINTGVKVTSSIAYSPSSFQETIDLMASGQLDVTPIVTKKIAFDEIVKEGFETLVSDKTQAKILVTLSGEQ
ncbi:2,3-butanediol dehydrogenase [Wohlfahrtiimonas chitiniclastica]|uniref:2,3-butanediol dehydrogenase n=1 Tax=Wohlfahrtiimonas chitiniclastica TaxID=400946 RepID=UPI001BCC1C48|nr:2,3-butanediol dehydrogenase [Wohlfahrtiimonas chitiniclastica]MBS7827839.1 2,3-butanediol dehydrogenase [Wohlfahrtiimonas chitiniclastica]